jgi:hypothetical protein
MSRLSKLIAKWKATAAGVAEYSGRSQAAEVLTTCAAELETALIDDLGMWVPTDVAARLTGQSQEELRRYARRAEGDPEAEIAVQRDGSGRWVFRLTDL